MSDFGKRVCLVHKLRQLVGSEERIDDRRQSLGVDQVDRRKHLVVAHIHTLADGTSHTGKAHTELSGELLAHGADTTVAQVVDIVDLGFAAQQFKENSL